jgi:hypothetical protein
VGIGLTLSFEKGIEMIKNVFATLTFFGFIYLFVFCVINLMLGCQTWDQSLWTEYNSCMTFAQSIGL